MEEGRSDLARQGRRSRADGCRQSLVSRSGAVDRPHRQPVARPAGGIRSLAHRVHALFPMATQGCLAARCARDGRRDGSRTDPDRLDDRAGTPAFGRRKMWSGSELPWLDESPPLYEVPTHARDVNNGDASFIGGAAPVELVQSTPAGDESFETPARLSTDAVAQLSTESVDKPVQRMSEAAHHVLAERSRQGSVEGFTPAHSPSDLSWRPYLPLALSDSVPAYGSFRVWILCSPPRLGICALKDIYR